MGIIAWRLFTLPPHHGCPMPWLLNRYGDCLLLDGNDAEMFWLLPGQCSFS